MNPLPEIDVDLCRQLAAGEPEEALDEWRRWIRKRPNATERAKYKKLLEILADVSESSIRNYLDGRQDKLSSELLDRLDRIARGLNQQPPPRSAPLPPAKRMRRATRVALLTQLAVPSEEYHFELIRGVVRETSFHHLSVAVHEVPAGELAPPVDNVLANFRPDGIVMIRLTPSKQVVKLLARARVPTVLIHADRYHYAAPVLANVIPVQDKVQKELKVWLRDHQKIGRRSGARRTKRRKIVVVTMPEEQLGNEFPAFRGAPPSIRNERRELVVQAFEEFGPVIFEVEDYSFRHALRVYESHPDADVYISLSDQIAVGIKHLLIAAGKPWRHRIVGFDASQAAKEEGIPSFDQRRGTIGKLAIERLCRFFSSECPGPWPHFDEIRTDVHLELRY